MKLLVKVFASIALFPSLLLAQSETQIAQIQLVDTGFIEVIEVLPDSFPKVELVLRVTDQSQNPVWDLSIEGFSVSENAMTSEILNVYQISKDKSINIGLVLDESGSMEIDESQLYDRNGNALYSFNFLGGLIFPKGYLMPINALKRASSNFIDGFDDTKDSVSITAFSSTVNSTVPRGSSIKSLKRKIGTLKAEGSTAFYDAVEQSLEELKSSAGLKVIVAITDGHDNSSMTTMEQVVLKAQLYEIPLHIIGLGNVNQDTLEEMANVTSGGYYYSPNALGLEDVYERVKGNIQSIYGVTYRSLNFNPMDTSREVLVRYVTDSSYASSSTIVDLPIEVVEYLSERRNKRVLYTTLGVGIAIGMGGFLLLYRKKQRQDIV